MNRRLSFLTLLTASVALTPFTVNGVGVSQAWAAGKVAARANVMDDYTRIVLDFDAPPSYLADQGKNSLKLTFQNANDFSAAGGLSGKPRIGSVRALSDKAIEFDFADAKEIRHFSIGNRVIVDVYGSKEKPTKTPLEDTSKEPSRDGRASESLAKKSDKNPDTNHESLASSNPVKELPNKISKDAAKADIQHQLIKGEHIVAAEDPTINRAHEQQTDSTVSPTEDTKIVNGKDAASLPKMDGAYASLIGSNAFRLGVVQSGQDLSIVVDGMDFASFPAFEGDKAIADQIAPVTKERIGNAILFSTRLPAGVHAHAVGGGLHWGIYVSKDSKNGTVPPTALNVAGAQLVWPVASAGQPVSIPDPVTGSMMTVVPVDAAATYNASSKNYVDLRMLPAVVGLAVLPKRDHLPVQSMPDRVVIGDAQKPLAISSSSDSSSPNTQLNEPSDEKSDTQAHAIPSDSNNASTESGSAAAPVASDTTRYFDFAKWRMGGMDKHDENKKTILNGFGQKPLAQQADALLSLAKMELANGFGGEAKGYLDYAVALVPELASAPTVKALMGAAQSLLGQDDRAFQLFGDDAFKNNAEIQMWRAATLGNLEDWAQASQNLPTYPALIESYPADVQIPIGLKLAEVALRNGDVKTADQLLDLLSKAEKSMHVNDKAALAYLRGEAARQKGQMEEAEKQWKPLTNGRDDLYRVKAGLSLTNLQLDKKEISPDEAIDRLEGFRYTWRGDELETAVNFRLGKLYIEKGEPAKGLSVLRQAAALSPQSDQATTITELMQKTYKDLFLSDALDKLSPVDAVTVYDEFSELTPTDEDGDKIVQRLADRLVEVDLLPRAANLLQTQIDTRLKGATGAQAATRLADILLMDHAPEKALDALKKADEFLKDVPVDVAAPLKKQAALLRADAYGQLNKPDEAYAALNYLPQDEAILRRRADIAWTSGRFQDAADSLQQLAQVMDVSPARPATDEQAALLLNWAVALHQADNKYVLADLRDRYSSAMAASPLRDKFDIITRPKQNSMIVDRASIDKIISEVDMFKTAGDDVKLPSDTPVTAAGDSAMAATAAAADVAPAGQASVEKPVPEKNGAATSSEGGAGDGAAAPKTTDKTPDKAADQTATTTGAESESSSPDQATPASVADQAAAAADSAAARDGADAAVKTDTNSDSNAKASGVKANATDAGAAEMQKTP